MSAAPDAPLPGTSDRFPVVKIVSIAIITLVVVSPLFLLVVASLKPDRFQILAEMGSFKAFWVTNPTVQNYRDILTFSGHHSEAALLGIFQVSVLHNIVHLLFGVAGILMARTASSSFLYLVAGGAVYLVLWVYGLLIDHHSAANFVPVNTADNWLHFVLGVGMVGLGLLLRGRSVPTGTRRTGPVGGQRI